MQVTAPTRPGGWRACLLAALFAGAAAETAAAELPELSNGKLGEACAGRSPDAVIGIARKSFCAGVITAVLETHAFAVEKRDASPAFCPGAHDIDARELSVHYLDWLDENPGRLDEPGVEGMVAMLALRYPCSR